MSVRINLLPDEFEERGRQRRMGVLAGLLVLVFAAAMGAWVYFMQNSVDDAVAARDQAQAAVNDVQADVNALAGFQALLDEQQTGDALVVTAMGGEIGVARVLNDVALTLPTTSSLTALSLARTDEDEATPGSIELSGEQVASLLLSGYSIERYAPGVEGVLLRFQDVTGLGISYLNQAAAAAISEVPVTTFDASGFLDGQILTGRYLDGMPREGR